jgi:hypothetical protein
VNRLPGRINYFLGNSPSQWHTNIPTYAGILYKNVYPGISLHLYWGSSGLEYDWLVNPGAHVGDIRMHVSGGTVRMDRSGAISLHAGNALLREGLPHARIGRAWHPVAGRYVRFGPHDFGFRVAAHHWSHTLTIDPSIIFATYLGGGDSEGGYGLTVDGQGNTYVVGDTQSEGFPVISPAQGALQSDPSCDQRLTHDCPDAFISKISSDGKTLLYSTFLGGTFDDYGHGVALDSAGNAYITGNTLSPNFPVVGSSSHFGGGGDLGDAYITKLSPQGNSILFSRFLGGTGDDDGEGIVESDGTVYVAGSTTSSDFPTSHAWQSSPGGGTCAVLGATTTTSGPCPDAFAAAFSDTGTSLYSTYIGGNNDDEATSIAVSNGQAYVVGGTSSTNFPTAHAVQSFGGGTCGDSDPAPCRDGFLTILAADGSHAIASTTIGGSNDDIANDVALGPQGDIYLTGTTLSPNFPLLHPIKSSLDTDDQDAFVTELDPSGTRIAYSTYFGGNDMDDAYGIAVDGGGSIYLTGSTLSTDFPVRNPIQGTLPVQPDVPAPDAGVQTAYVSVLSSDGSRVVYGTYFGDNGQPTDNILPPITLGADIAVDGEGNTYVTGFTVSDQLPISSPALQTDYGGAFVLKIHDAAPPLPTPTAIPTAVPSPTPVPTSTRTPTKTITCKKGYKHSHGRCVKKKKKKL